MKVEIALETLQQVANLIMQGSFSRPFGEVQAILNRLDQEVKIDIELKKKAEETEKEKQNA